MNEDGPRERLRENATAITSTVVTGVWLAALLTGQGWWLGALILGYVVVVPIVAMLFGDEDDRREWWDDWSDWGSEERSDSNERDRRGAEARSGRAGREDDRDALATLRDRYARGELTDEQFERKLERLLETETLEAVEDRRIERERAR
jgi:uncharacterized membrane protein